MLQSFDIKALLIVVHNLLLYVKIVNLLFFSTVKNNNVFQSKASKTYCHVNYNSIMVLYLDLLYHKYLFSIIFLIHLQYIL